MPADVTVHLSMQLRWPTRGQQGSQPVRPFAARGPTCFTKSTQSREWALGKFSLLLNMIMVAVWVSSFTSKGARPTTSSYANTPAAHTSTCRADGVCLTQAPRNLPTMPTMHKGTHKKQSQDRVSCHDSSSQIINC